MNNTHYVYWYKRKKHTDPYTQGYIGITNDMKRRNNEHLRNVSNTHFVNALTKYDDIDYIILHTTTYEEALVLEYEYRPALNIGWNYAVGGEDTLSSVQSTPISMYHKDNYVILYTFNSIKEASLFIECSEGALRQKKSRGHTHYDNNGWAILHDPNHDRTTTVTITEIKSAIGKKPKGASHFKGMINRWTEEEKQRISKQHKGKSITQKQIDIVRAKNRANHPSCRAVTLVHQSNPDITYMYHSISEASRQLNIPLPRLKSKAQRPLNTYGKDGWKITHLGS